jgi:lysophospholipase L1-like esterase
MHFNLKKIAFICITFLGVILSTVIIAEISLRLFWDGKPKPKTPGLINYYYPEPTPEIGFVLKPDFCLHIKENVIRTNKFGFRIPRNVEFKKEKGLFRVVLLGDSIIFGYNTYEDVTISSLINNELKRYKIPGTKEIQTLNFGVPGYNMTQYLAVLKKYGLKYKPDVVVVGLAIINDFDGFFMSYLTNGLLNPIPAFDSKGYNYELRAPSRFLWNSYLFRQLYYKFAPSWEKLRKGPKNPHGIDRRYRMRLPASCNNNDELWTNIKEIMDEFKTISQKNNIKIVFLLFPTTEQIYYQNTKVHIPMTPQQIIARLLDERGMQYIDLFDIFCANFSSSGQLPYRDIDSHPNDHAYKLSASLTTAWIAQQMRLELSSSFNGTINMGEAEAPAFLSYGWTGIRQDGINYRFAEGGESRIVFNKFKDNIKSVEITARNAVGCNSQEMRVHLNNKFLKSMPISTNSSFSAYKINLEDPVIIKNLNYLDLSFSCAAKPAGWKSAGKHRPRYYSAAVSSVIIK